MKNCYSNIQIMSDEELLIAIKIRYRQLREEQELKQIEFAHKYNLDRQQVNNWESFNSTRGVSIYTINRFCKMIDRDIKYFFDSSLFKGGD